MERERYKDEAGNSESCCAVPVPAQPSHSSSHHLDSPQFASHLSNVKSVFRNPTPIYSTNNGHVLHSASRADNRVTVVCLQQQFYAFYNSVTMTVDEMRRGGYV